MARPGLTPCRRAKPDAELWTGGGGWDYSLALREAVQAEVAFQMFDIRAIRENPASFESAWNRRRPGLGSEAVGEILELDARWRDATTARQEAETVRNSESKRIGQAKARGDLQEADRLMQLVAEVYQSDRQRLHVGQPVRITSSALAMPLEGRITRIGAIVRRQSMINTDPSANTDARVIEVHAELDPASSRRAADLSNLQVTAVFGA